MKKLLQVLFSTVLLTFSLQAGSEPAYSAKIPTYFQGAHLDVDSATDKLEDAGFDIVATYDSIKDGETIVFTCPTLKAEAAKPNRSFIAVMRLFIDNKEKTISITNPVYWGKAFMQDEYNHDKFTKVLNKIKNAFPGLKSSSDMMYYDDIAGYHFSYGMPYYGDQVVLAEASNKKLLASAKDYKNGKDLVFELKLSEKSTLLGYAIGSDTAMFPNKIGRANAGLLPWTIAIEDGKAKTLQGEYYIAISYPLLDMNGFMDIKSIPDSVIEDLAKPFKNIK